MERRLGIFIRKGGELYKICTIYWGKDLSVYMKLHRVDSSSSRGLGSSSAVDGRWSIFFSDELEPLRVRHSVVHGTGISQFSMDGVPSRARESGMSLRNLVDARPLWTVIPRISADRKWKGKTRDSDFIIDEPVELIGRALYLIAFPKIDLHLQLADEINQDGSVPDFGFFWFDAGQYVMAAVLHSNDRMVEPQWTLNIPSARNHSAWVDKISEVEVSGTYKAILRNI